MDPADSTAGCKRNVTKCYRKHRERFERKRASCAEHEKPSTLTLAESKQAKPGNRIMHDQLTRICSFRQGINKTWIRQRIEPSMRGSTNARPDQYVPSKT
jgi:hypothetical protein